MTVAAIPAPSLAPSRGISGRSAAVDRAYAEHASRVRGTCAFCDHAIMGEQYVAARGGMLVLRNRFPYAVWESREVIDHLMVVPARHLLTLGDLTGAEAADFMALAVRYESEGYSVYTRSQAHTGRSVAHAHTHLILVGDVVA